MFRLSTVFGALTLLTTVETSALARSTRVEQVPNGGVFRCLTCHDQQTGGPLNVFGTQVEDTLVGSGPTATVDWPAVAPLDADGDGRTNGEELGDPDGDGVADAGADVTNPGVDDREPEPEPVDTGEGDDVDAGGCDHGGTGPQGMLAAAIALVLLTRRRW